MTIAAYFGLLALLLGLVGDVITTIRLMACRKGPIGCWFSDHLGVLTTLVANKALVGVISTVAVFWGIPHPLTLLVWPLALLHFWIMRNNVRKRDRIGQHRQ